jgi:hypothetical protein
MKTTRLITTACLVVCSQAHSQLAINQLCSSQTMDGTMVDFELYNDTVYGTGFFTQICGNSVNYASSWDGNSWGTSGLDLHRQGHSLRAIGSDLYAVTYANAPSDSNWVFRYDGNNLDTLGKGVYLTTALNFSNLACIYDVIEYNNEIYACGEFDRVGGQTVSGIIRWDGAGWNDVGGGVSGSLTNYVMYPHQMTVLNGMLYLVGNFQFAGSIEVNGIAGWDGTNWSALGDGFNGTVYGVGSFNNELYAGGDFTESDGTSLNRIAKWDGSNWVSPGFGFTDVNPYYTFVHTFYAANNGLYIGGGLHEVTPDVGASFNCGGLVFFDGTNVSTFSGGVLGNDIEAVIEGPDGELLVGGGVFGTGYVGIVQDVTGIEESSLSDIQILPNPATEVIKITSELPFTTFQIIDLNGQVVKEGVVKKEINISALDTGIYWVQALHNGNLFSTKFVKQ